MGTEIKNFVQKKKNVGVRYDEQFLNLIRSFTRFEIVNPGNDVIHDAQKVIWDINLLKFGDIGKFCDIGSFGNIGTGRI